MRGLVSVVIQEPGFVGLVAALAVVIFLATSFLLLVVAVGNEGVAGRASDDEDLIEDQVPIDRGSPAEKPVADVPIEVLERRIGIPPAPKVVDRYASGMASSLRGIAVSVMQRAAPRAEERILDGATGDIFPASAALLAGRNQMDVDVDRGTLAIGRREAGADVVGAEFAALPFRAGWFQVVLSVHSLQFAANPVGVLTEWRRVASSGARLSLSVPGPRAALGMSKLDHIYRRYGAAPQIHLPTLRVLAGWATAAGWQQVKAVAAPDTVIRLWGREAFSTWLGTRPWSDPDQALTREQLKGLEEDLHAAMPTGANGQLLIPFGTLYLIAINLEPPA